MVGNAHDHADVVLDQHHRHAELTVDLDDEAAHFALLLGIHPGHRLVEQQQARLGGQRTGQLDPLLQAIGQGANDFVTPRLDAQKLDYPLGGGALAIVLARRAADAQRLLQPGTAALEVAPGEHVVEHAHALEQRDVLEGASDAVACRCMWVHHPTLLPGKTNTPLLRPVDAIDDVQQRALARAIGPDQRTDLAFGDAEADVADGLHTLERKADALQFQQR